MDMYFYLISIFEFNLIAHNVASSDRERSWSAETGHLSKDNDNWIRTEHRFSLGTVPALPWEIEIGQSPLKGFAQTCTVIRRLFPPQLQ